MNVWVEMAKGLKIGNPDWLAAADELKAAVRESRLVVPLSAAHYMELWHRRDQASREAVGALMRDIADYVSLSPIQRVRDLEVDALVDRHLGGRRRIEAPDLLARGVVHASDSPHGRLRFVSSIETADEPEGSAADAPVGVEDLRAQPPLWEWIHLVGTQELIAADGLDRTPEHRHGSRYVDQELDLRRRISADPSLRSRLLDYIITEEITDLTDAINRACRERETDPHILILGRGGTPADAIRKVVLEIPSVDVVVRLRWWKHKDLGLQ
ncbi:hypothetical protein OG921_22775 [Aldersonia sp. NBC_00410]|nr:hypothetical protein [Aldersonia sp. NBC_00410]